jgi:hypothetical protein
MMMLTSGGMFIRLSLKFLPLIKVRLEGVAGVFQPSPTPPFTKEGNHTVSFLEET